MSVNAPISVTANATKQPLQQTSPDVVCCSSKGRARPLLTAHVNCTHMASSQSQSLTLIIWQEGLLWWVKSQEAEVARTGRILHLWFLWCQAVLDNFLVWGQVAQTIFRIKWRCDFTYQCSQFWQISCMMSKPVNLLISLKHRGTESI